MISSDLQHVVSPTASGKNDAKGSKPLNKDRFHTQGLGGIDEHTKDQKGGNVFDSRKISLEPTTITGKKPFNERSNEKLLDSNQAVKPIDLVGRRSIEGSVSPILSSKNSTGQGNIALTPNINKKPGG